MRAILVTPDHTLTLADAPSPPMAPTDLRIAVLSESSRLHVFEKTFAKT